MEKLAWLVLKRTGAGPAANPARCTNSDKPLIHNRYMQLFFPSSVSETVHCALSMHQSDTERGGEIRSAPLPDSRNRKKHFVTNRNRFH
jgi:hypothetical protein